MIHLKKSLLTLVALIALTAQAWATDVITVTWSSGDTYENNNSKDGVTLSGANVRYDGEEWQLAFFEGKGTFTTELGNFTKIEITGGYIDGFSGEGWSGRTWTGNAAAVPFNGYITDANGEEPWTITFTIEPASSASTVDVDWNKTSKTGTFTMPAGNVELQVEYYPGMLVKPTNLVGGTMEIEGLTDTTLPEGFEKDDDGNIYVAKDTKFTVKAVPAEGYHLVGWSDDAENKELEREFTMGDDDFILTATFSDEYDLAFNALNANTIEDGKATVKVGDTDKTATLIQDGKLSMKSGQTVTLTAATGYKFRTVEAKKTGSAVLAPALENGATVVIICDWGDATTTFTYTNNGGTFSGQASGYDAGYFHHGLELNGKNLSFDARNVDNSEYLSVGITFNTESSAYSYTGKGEDFSSFTISVNGTDVTSQLSELK